MSRVNGNVARSDETTTVLVIGAGIAGVSCARRLISGNLSVEVREGTETSGGRMFAPRLHGRPVDLGASYFTVRYPDFSDIVAHWVKRGLARGWTESFHAYAPGGETTVSAGPLRYAAPAGLTSLVRDLAADLPIRYDAPVRRVGPGPTADGQPYAAVVLAMPDASALHILDESLAEERAAVEWDWDPVVAVATGYPDRSWPFVDGAFVNDHPVLSFVADDGARRGDGAPVLVAHSTTAYARSLGPADDPAGPMLEALRELVPATPYWVHTHVWPRARPVRGRGDDPTFHLGDAMVGLCGDSWGSPRVETAWSSGAALGSALLGRLQA
ncbi:NAD(P)/FAD-dependent oxidoreductase [Fodinicola acaciae]|uniref:NAD(P)/FAD-dependent oxidoreductase n=1 Tax=Fodinicola acaciae TaxID=2681555 RepID=UPI0013D82A1F|nr:FAD-dependent oxidoreductase [Fodinicola acaciae]